MTIVLDNELNGRITKSLRREQGHVDAMSAIRARRRADWVDVALDVPDQKLGCRADSIVQVRQGVCADCGLVIGEGRIDRGGSSGLFLAGCTDKQNSEVLALDRGSR